MPSNTLIYKVFKFVDGQTTNYRIIYQQPNGFTEALAEVMKSGSSAKSNNKISVQSHQAYLINDKEQVIELGNDSLLSEVFGEVYVSYPELKGQ